LRRVRHYQNGQSIEVRFNFGSVYLNLGY
jgi:hypothetical protein